MINKVQSNGGIATYIGIGTDTTQPVHNPELISTRIVFRLLSSFV